MPVLHPVRRRPWLYVGDTSDGSGLHKLLFMVVDNAVAEARAGHCDRIDVQLNAGGSVTVRDNGRGIPTDIPEGAGVSAAEFLMTHADPVQNARRSAAFAAKIRMGQLRVGELPDPIAYRVAGGMPSAGLAIVNALSDQVDLRIWRDGREHFMRFHGGEPEARLAIVGAAGQSDGRTRRGTEITFLPSPAVFETTAFDVRTIEEHLRGIALPDARVTVTLTDARSEQGKEIR